MINKSTITAVTLCGSLISIMSAAQQQDVTFFVVGKHANYDQDVAGDLHSVDYSFFSEIFLTRDGDATNAMLTLPTGETIAYTDQRRVDGPDKDNLLLIRGEKRYDSYDELQSRYPDGDYSVSFDSPSGDITGELLSFPGDRLPTPPVVEVRQNGELVCGGLNANIDLEVSWTPFAQGRADDRGVLDDLIFVILEDEDGKRASHSGRPFEDRPYLTFADNSHIIDAAAMQAGQTYVLSVEHAVLADTHLSDQVPSMTTTAVTTKLPLETLAVQQAGDCQHSTTRSN